MTLTATAELEVAPAPPAEPPALASADRPVFAAATPARPRALRLAGRATAVLVGLWLVALVLGTFGFGPVAGIGLPRIGGGSESGHRDAASKHPAGQSAERATRGAVTLTTRYSGNLATPASLRSGQAGARHRSTARRAPSTGGNHGSQPGGTNGGTTGSATHTPVPSPAQSGTATPTSANPAPAPTTSNSHSTNSQAAPPGSSSTAPGSRSNAGTAPGRDQSASTPSPGSGSVEHAPPKG
jgi:hypothetical protein